MNQTTRILLIAVVAFLCGLALWSLLPDSEPQASRVEQSGIPGASGTSIPTNQYINSRFRFSFSFPADLDVETVRERDDPIELAFCDVAACNYAEQVSVSPAPAMSVEELDPGYAPGGSSQKWEKGEILETRAVIVNDYRALLIKARNLSKPDASDKWLHIIVGGRLYTFASVPYGPLAASASGPVNIDYRTDERPLPLFMATFKAGE